MNMYRRIVKMNGKKILVYSRKTDVINCFCYAMKYFKQTEDIKINKNTWTIKFENGIYSYTFVLPKDFIQDFLTGLFDKGIYYNKLFN